VDWHYWTGSGCSPGIHLLRHGKGHDGCFLPCAWDRVNGETAFMYVLAAGATDRHRVDRSAWGELKPFHGTLAGRRFNNPDLGLFVFQYGLDLLDFEHWQAPGEFDLAAEARLATEANREFCRSLSSRFSTYHRFWGLSAGDGPGMAGQHGAYRCYSPSGPIDGTAHVMATLASVAHCPGQVLENLYEAHHDLELRAHGPYGFSNINLDQQWVGRDIVGIDAGAAVLALDNFLMNHRVRQVFHRLPCVQRGLNHLGFTARAASTVATPDEGLRQAS
jgi:hypothetical protein